MNGCGSATERYVFCYSRVVRSVRRCNVVIRRGKGIVGWAVTRVTGESKRGGECSVCGFGAQWKGTFSVIPALYAGLADAIL
jgi:hypothetical protein